MIHSSRERRLSRPLIAVLVLLGWWILILGVAAGCCTLARDIVGHSLAWCLDAGLLLGPLLTLISILLLGTLLVLVGVLLVVLGMLWEVATVPLI